MNYETFLAQMNLGAFFLALFIFLLFAGYGMYIWFLKPKARASASHPQARKQTRAEKEHWKEVNRKLSDNHTMKLIRMNDSPICNLDDHEQAIS